MQKNRLYVGSFGLEVCLAIRWQSMPLNVKNWKSQKMDSTCPFLRLFSVIFLSLAGVPVIADGVPGLSEGRTRF